jgi:hypothetical protein
VFPLTTDTDNRQLPSPHQRSTHQRAADIFAIGQVGQRKLEDSIDREAPMMIVGIDPGRWVSAFDLHWVFRLIVGDPAFGPLRIQPSYIEPRYAYRL